MRRPARAQADPHDELDHAAAAFDEQYTWLTGLQREIVAAQRDNDLPAARATALARKAWAAAATVDHVRQVAEAADPDPRTLQLQAVRAALLVSPLNASLAVPLLAGLKRSEGFPLVAELLRAVASSGIDAAELADKSVAVLVAAVGGVGDRRAAFALRHANLDPAITLGGACEENLETLADALIELSHPDGLRILNGQAPRQLADPSGKGESAAVLLAFVRGAEREGLVFDDSERLALVDPTGWPTDAPTTADLLAQWALRHIGVAAFPKHQLLFDIWPEQHDHLRDQLGHASAAHERAAHAAYDAAGEDNHAAALDWLWMTLAESLRDIARQAIALRQVAMQPAESWGSQPPLLRAKRLGTTAGSTYALACEVLDAMPTLPNPTSERH